MHSFRGRQSLLTHPSAHQNPNLVSITSDSLKPARREIISKVERKYGTMLWNLHFHPCNSAWGGPGIYCTPCSSSQPSRLDHQQTSGYRSIAWWPPTCTNFDKIYTTEVNLRNSLQRIEIELWNKPVLTESFSSLSRKIKFTRSISNPFFKYLLICEEISRFFPILFGVC